MSQDIVERLSGYNPPDRTLIDDVQIAVDLHDALAEIISLRERVKLLEPAASMSSHYRERAVVAEAENQSLKLEKLQCKS